MYAEISFDDLVFGFDSDHDFLFGDTAKEIDRDFDVSELPDFLCGRLPRQAELPDIRFYFDDDGAKYYPIPDIFYGKYRHYSKRWFYKLIKLFIECTENMSILERTAGVDRAREYWNLCNDLGSLIPIHAFECYDIQEYPRNLESWGMELLKDTAASRDVVEFIDAYFWYIDGAKFAKGVIQNDYMVCESDPVTGIDYIYRD